MVDVRTTRRGAVGAAAFGLATMTMAEAQVPEPPRAGRKTFVLVHGAWHGGWCWRRVTDSLEGKGQKVFAPTMTGLGERSNLIAKGIDVSTHAADICNVLEWENLSDIVLVGHSYGGSVINGVAERLAGRIGSIVFLDAFLPDNGERLIDKATPAFREAISHNELSFKSPPASAFGVQGQDGVWVDSKTTPQPTGTFTEAAVVTGARERIARKMFIRAKLHASPTFDANLAKTKADPSWTTHELASGHDAMVIQPEPLAALLMEA